MQSHIISFSLSSNFYPTSSIPLEFTRVTTNYPNLPANFLGKNKLHKIKFKCCSENSASSRSYRTCKNCKTQFDPALNHPLACKFHSAHFGGETKRKFESVYTGGTMNTPNAGQVLEYWHCCGSEDAFDPGCTSTPHLSYDD